MNCDGVKSLPRLPRVLAEAKAKRRFVMQMHSDSVYYMGFVADHWRCMEQALCFYNDDEKIVGLFNSTDWRFCRELSDSEAWPDFVRQIWGDE